MTTPYHDHASTPVAVWPAVRRRPLLVILPLIIFAAAGLAGGLLRPQSYTASAGVIVGDLSVSTNNLPAAVNANEVLASTFAGVVGTATFDDRLAAQLGPRGTSGVESLSGLAVPGSAIVELTATSRSRSTALATASAAATVLARYGNDGASAQSATSLLTRYNAMNQRLQTVQQQLTQDQASLDAAGVGASTTLRNKVARERAQVATLQLQATSLGNSYSEAQQAGGNGGTAQVAGTARLTGSNRTRNEEIGVGIGAIAGLIVGLAAALWLASRSQRAAEAEARRRNPAGSGSSRATNRLRTHDSFDDSEAAELDELGRVPSPGA